MAEVVVRLPEALRDRLKEPAGPIETDPETLVAAVEGPLITVGDIVTYHCERAGRVPDVAVIDGRTKRSAVAPEIREAVADDADTVVENPPATLTAELLDALRAGIDAGTPTRIRVEGEEDLATLPAIVAAPDGASVVYGQPEEGMVHVRVTPERRAWARDLIERMDGDPGRALATLDGSG